MYRMIALVAFAMLIAASVAPANIALVFIKQSGQPLENRARLTADISRALDHSLFEAAK